MYLFMCTDVYINLLYVYRFNYVYIYVYMYCTVWWRLLYCNCKLIIMFSSNMCFINYIMLNDFKLYHVKLKLYIYIYIILNTCLSIACFVFWYDNQWDITGPIFVIKAIPDFVSEWPLLVGEVGVHVKKNCT